MPSETSRGLTSVVPTPPLGDDSVQHGFNELWQAALCRYKEETGHDLLKHKFANDLLSPSATTDTVVQFFNRQIEAFKDFRARGRRLLDVLTHIVRFVHRVVDVSAEATSVRISVPIVKQNFASNCPTERVAWWQRYFCRDRRTAGGNNIFLL